VRLAVKLAATPLGLLLAFVFVVGATTGSQASGCSTSGVAGPGPATVSGVPPQYLPTYEAAAAYDHLGPDGWAYLAAINYAESTDGADNGPGTGVLSGSNSAGAAGPMQIGIGGAATDNWDTYKLDIPPNLAGGAQPPSVYNEADAVYAAAAKLHADGAPGDWQGALQQWNNFAPEIDQVNQLVAQYTSTAQGTQGTLVSTSAGGVDQASAASYADGVGVKVGFAVVTAGGQVLAQDNGDMQVPGASITKAMLLVAYLQQLGNRPVPPAAQAELEPMIEISDNAAGSWTFAQVGAPAVERVAAQADMTHFVLDTGDPAYTLGQSLVTALDQARFFSRVEQLMPAANRAYGMGLLDSISAGDRWGILDAGVGVTASKAGWKTEGAVWVVNQAGQLQAEGQTAGLAVVSEGATSMAAGESIMQTVASDLLPAGQTQGAAIASGVQCAAVSGASTPGAASAIAANGLAAIPQGTPAAVQEMIAAGNEITSYPYSYGGGHCVAAMQVPPGPGSCAGNEENGAAGYDCSSATSFVLWGGGLGQSLLGGQVDASGALESVGDPGPGQWVTIYAGESGGQGHAFIEVAGVVLDTVHGQATDPAETGPRWQPAAEVAYELAHGSFVARHPAGL
jgi:beta-lactamase class A